MNIKNAFTHFTYASRYSYKLGHHSLHSLKLPNSACNHISGNEGANKACLIDYDKFTFLIAGQILSQISGLTLASAGSSAGSISQFSFSPHRH
jgi:hypothetical protein